MDKNELIEEFSKCRENLERYAVSLTGNIEDAEDLVSDLCIALLERNTDVEEIRFPRAFFNTPAFDIWFITVLCVKAGAYA